MSLTKNYNRIENIILILISIIFPWSIMFATPQLHTGYWGQVEGMIVFNHFFSAIIALLILKVGINNKERTTPMDERQQARRLNRIKRKEELSQERKREEKREEKRRKEKRKETKTEARMELLLPLPLYYSLKYLW